MSYNILVVDDDEHIQLLISSFLKSSGYNFKILSDPKDALNEIHRNKYDLVVLDISMPGVNGLDILKTLRDDELHKNTSVLMLTSSSDRENVLSASGLNVSAYMIKPPSKVDFLRRVEEALIHKYNLNGYSFNKSNSETKGSFSVPFEIKSINSEGMVLNGSIPLPEGFVLEKFRLPVFDEINLSQSNYSVKLCTKNKNGNYSYVISFAHLSSVDKKKIKNWISNENFLTKMISKKPA